MITITWQALIGYFVAGCAGFATICVAVGWLIKIVKAVKKPNDDINKKLDNDHKRLNNLEEQTKFLYRAISLLLQDDLAILEHLRTDNNTGKMAEQEQKVQDFLIQRK